MKNPFSFLTKKQFGIVHKEIQEEGYAILQAYKKNGKKDYRVLKDTIIITPTNIIDRIKWAAKRVIKK